MIRTGQLATLQLSANGAVIGQPRRSDDVVRGWSHSDSNRRSTATHDASVLTLQSIASVDKHRVTVDDDHVSRDYVGPSPEVLMASARWVGDDTLRRERQRQRHSTSDFASSRDRSRDRHQLPVQRDAATWPEPEEVDEVRARRPTRAQSGGIVASSVDVKRTGHRRRAAHDTREDDVVRHRRHAVDSHTELHRQKQAEYNGEGDRITSSVNAVVDVDHEAGVNLPPARPKLPNTEATSVGVEQTADDGHTVSTTTQSVVLVGGSPSAAANEPPAQHGLGASHPADHNSSSTALQSVARSRSAAAAVPTSNQIWWPCQESGDERSSNSDDDSRDDDRNSNTDEANLAAAAATAAANNDDTAQMTSWTEIDVSVAESIRELDNFLLQQDSDPL